VHRLPLRPGAPGPRAFVVAIRPEAVTGRRLV
jgi:hypothetical protein